MFRRARVDKIKYIYVSNLPSFWWEDYRRVVIVDIFYLVVDKI